MSRLTRLSGLSRTIIRYAARPPAAQEPFETVLCLQSLQQHCRCLSGSASGSAASNRSTLAETSNSSANVPSSTAHSGFAAGTNSATTSSGSTQAVNEGAAPAAAAAAATAATRLKGWLYNGPTLKPEPERSHGWGLSRLFFWRQGPSGRLQKMPIWEKWSWVVGMAGMTIWLYQRLDRAFNKVEDQAAVEKRKALEKRRIAALPLARSGRSFLEGEDPFDGLSPRDIDMLVQANLHKGGKGSGAGGFFSDDDDPYEGMTPKEIDEHVSKYGIGSR